MSEQRPPEELGPASVVGLGKLGASIAAAMASRGVEVVGVDLAPEVVAAINAGRAPVFEPGLPELLCEAGPRLRATDDYPTAIAASQVTFVVVPTPSEADGSYSLRFAEASFAAIGAALREKAATEAGYHLVVLTSTVLPGDVRERLLPVLERESGLEAGRDFGLCYSPEFVALGSVIHDFLHPDLLLIGEHDERAGATLEGWYRALLGADAPVRRMSLENAELAKVALNSFVTTKISFANMLAGLCEALPGGDVDAVTGALGLDPRIGPRYLKGGMGYGGPCFPRDNAALRQLATRLRQPDQLLEATDALNDERLVQVVRGVAREAAPGATVAVLGLAYKPGSDFIEASQGVALANALAVLGLDVIAFDPLAGEAARDALSGDVAMVDSLEAAISVAGVVVLANADPAFGRVAELAGRRASLLTAVDCWRAFEASLAPVPEVRYVPLGRGLPLVPGVALGDSAAQRLAGRPGASTAA